MTERARGVDTPFPAWARALVAADGALASALAIVELARDAAVDALPPTLRANVSEALRLAAIADGTLAAESDVLAVCEERLVTHAAFPGPGEAVVLVVAGGRREARALAARGFEVVVEEAEASALASSPRADAALLGWRALDAALDHAARVALLERIRSACSGPLAVTFGSPFTDPVFGPAARLRSTIGASLRVRAEALWRPLTEVALAAAARDAGYDVAFVRLAPTGHALLVPRAGAPRGSPRHRPPVEPTLPAPALARAVRASASMLRRLDHGVAKLRDRVLESQLDPAMRSAATAHAYASNPNYAPGGLADTAGVFAWEEWLVAQPSFPRRGRVVVGGAGGGREVDWLAARGYSVIGFDPSIPTAARRRDANPIVDGAYRDLVALMKGNGAGPLAAVTKGPIDAFVFGWGSFAHLLDDETEIATLRAVRALAPHAPVLVSYFVRARQMRIPSTAELNAGKRARNDPDLAASASLPRARADHHGDSQDFRIRDARHRRANGVPDAPDAAGAPDIAFVRTAGYVRLRAPGSFARVAAAAGYRAAVGIERGEQPCALLVANVASGAAIASEVDAGQ